MNRLNKTSKKDVSKDQLITILRKPAGLFVLISRPKSAFTMSFDNPEQNNSYDELDDFYEVIEMPIDHISTSLFPRKNKLLKSWNRITNVRRLDATIHFHVLRILMETQSYTVPKPPLQIGMWNLQRRLFDAKDRNRLLRDLNPHWDEALGLLRSAGYKIQTFQNLDPSFQSTRDPYFIHHFSHCENVSNIPESFRISILPLLKGRPWKTVKKWLGLYRSLQLERKQNLLRCISRMLAVGEEGLVRVWCERIVSCSPTRRSVFATLIIETQLFQRESISEDILSEFFNLTTKKQLPGRLYYFLHALKRNISIDYLFAGFRLANRFSKDYIFHTFQDCNEFPFDSVVELTDVVRSISPPRGVIALSIWEQCGKLYGFAKLIQTPIWKQIGVQTAYSFLYFLAAGVRSSHSPDNIKAQKKLTTKVIPETLEFLRDHIARTYRKKFCRSLADLCWTWPRLDRLVKDIPLYREVLSKFCVEPFNKNHLNVGVLFLFIGWRNRLGMGFMAAPQSSFLAMEKASSSNNDTFLIERGTRTLLRKAPLFTIKSFQHFPNKLFHTTKILGVFRMPSRIRAIQEFLRTPIMTQHFRKLSILEAGKQIRNQLVDGVTNPIPKALTKFLDGEYALTKARLSRYRRIMFENLNLTRLELLEQFILGMLKNHYSSLASDKNVYHALQLMNLIHKNRRQLRRFLRSYLSGNMNYVVDHPRSKQWLSAHANLDFTIWQKGIRFSKEVDEYGEVQIQLENDPFEVLKMGTYAGSCLGLGGGNAFSAAAVMLDINKQVLYARNKDGKVVGRQLVAFSEENKLVCFPVYPIGTKKKLKDLFRIYDRRFAKELMVPISLDSSYNIENILSQDWYDDYAWDLKE